MTPLCELAIKYGTDKCGKHQYTPVYYDLLKDKKVKRVLEIGVYNGASLRMWRDFFPGAEIYGIDIDLRSLIKEDRITCFAGDQTKAYTLRNAALVAGGEFDLIVDDGSHVPDDQILTAWELLPFLAPNGLYIIEDVGAHEYKVGPGALIADLPPSYEYLVPLLPPGDPEQLVVIRHR